MDFKVPSIASAIVFVLIFLINLIKGNTFGIVMLRSFVSAAITFGLFFAVMFVFKTVLGISSDDFGGDSSPDDSDDVLGQNFDATIGDDESSSDITPENADYSDSDVADNDESADISGTDDDNFLTEEGHSYEDEGFADVGTSSSGSKTSEEAIRDTLGYDASAEDLAKAIRTIIPRDDT